MDNQNQKEDILKFLKKKELPEDAVLSLKDLSEFHHENLSMSGADHLIKAALEHTGTSSPSPPVVPPADKSSQQHEGKAEGIKKEDYTVFVKQLQKEVLAELVPAKILGFKDIGFIPKYPILPPLPHKNIANKRLHQGFALSHSICGFLGLCMCRISTIDGQRLGTGKD